jgi:hypothetical protein
MRKPYVPTKSLAALSERELIAKTRWALCEVKELFEALQALEEARGDHVRAKLCSIALRHLEAAARVIAPASIDS